MKKNTLLMIALPLVVAVFVLAGITYWQRRPPLEANPLTTLLEYDAEGKSPREMARWIYDNHGCVECHTLTNTGLFGLTPLGQERAEGFEGCPGMLKTVWETLAIAEEGWSERQRKVRSDFVDFGCTLCHEVGPTAVGLTPIGSRAALLHMSCSGVDSILNASSSR